MKTHDLKTDPAVFQAVWEGRKDFEIRRNDRDFNNGELLLLRETTYDGYAMAKLGKKLSYTGRWILVRVKYIHRGPIYGLENGWVIMSLEAAPTKGEDYNG